MTLLDSIPYLPAKRFTPGREAKVTDIVVHWMAGTLASTDATFTSGVREASAHYGIEGTTIHQYVRAADTAWHSGDRAENHRSIGIEHSAQPGRDATPETITTSVTLITALCRKYGISPDHIYPHKKFYATACPGTLPVAEIVARVTAQLAHPTTPTTEVDLPLTDADAIKVATQVWNRFTITTPTGPVSLAVALARILAALEAKP